MAVPYTYNLPIINGQGGGTAQIDNGQLDISGGIQGNQNPLLMDWNQLGIGGKLGVVSQGLGAFSNLASLYSGFKALSLQKKQFKFARDAWNKNYGNQVKDYENTLRDRWAARRASAGARGAGFESMGSWVGSRALTGAPPASHSGQIPQGG